MPERRLATVTEGLTVKERARLVLRAFTHGDEPDQRLTKYIPPEQRAEYQPLIDAALQANDNAYQAIALWYEWLTANDLELALLECMSAYQAREEKLLPLAQRGRRKPLVLPEMPVPGRGLKRDLPLLFGVLDPGDEEVRASWPEEREQLERALRETIGLRWMELAAADDVVAELDQLWGENAWHEEVLQCIARCHAKVAELHASHQLLAGPWELPAATPERAAPIRAWVEWEAFSPPPGRASAGDPRLGLYPAAREELAQQEAAWAEELREG